MSSTNFKKEAPERIDPTKAFQFLRINDSGPMDDGGGTCCPHCGAEGRYVYVWAEYGVERAAMAGCYAKLVGHIKKDDLTNMMVGIALKQSRNKPLNGWEKTVLKMQGFIAEGKYSPEWCQTKIMEAIQDKNRFQAQKWGGR